LPRTAALSKTMKKMSRLFGNRLTTQCVHQGALQVREELLRALGHVAAEEALHEDAVQRAHEQAGVEPRVDRLAEEPVASSALDDVGEPVPVDTLQLVHVTDEIGRMLLLAQDEAQEELHRVTVLGAE